MGHELFLSSCITENIIQNGLKRELERTIGNHDENFLSNCYDKLQQHSLKFMKNIETVCDKTFTNVKAEMENTEKNLTTNVKYKTFQEVQNLVNSNQNFRYWSLKQRKLKKFNQVKYLPRQD